MELVPRELWKGEITTDNQFGISKEADKRREEYRFYEGIVVKCKRKEFVMGTECLVVQTDKESR